MQQINWHGADEKPSANGDYLCKRHYVDFNSRTKEIYHGYRFSVEFFDGEEWDTNLTAIVAWSEIPSCDIEWKEPNG